MDSGSKELLGYLKSKVEGVLLGSVACVLVYDRMASSAWE